jgi:hypothetical protein
MTSLFFNIHCRHYNENSCHSVGDEGVSEEPFCIKHTHFMNLSIGLCSTGYPESARSHPPLLHNLVQQSNETITRTTIDTIGDSPLRMGFKHAKCPPIDASFIIRCNSRMGLTPTRTGIALAAVSLISSITNHARWVVTTSATSQLPFFDKPQVKAVAETRFLLIPLQTLLDEYLRQLTL